MSQPLERVSVTIFLCFFLKVSLSLRMLGPEVYQRFGASSLGYSNITSMYFYVQTCPVLVTSRPYRLKVIFWSAGMLLFNLSGVM